MRICVDVRCLMGGRRTGVEEYTLNLLMNLFAIDKENEYVLFLNTWSNPIFDYSIFDQYPNVRLCRFFVPNKIFNFLSWYVGWPLIDHLVGGADVVFMPNIIFGAVSRSARLITTIHDLSFEQHPEYFSWKRRFWHTFINPKKICRRADKLITVSDSTKNDLETLYGTETTKIRVIYSAVGQRFKPIDRNDSNLVRIKDKYGLPYKFILYLGTIEPRKNIIGIVRAFSRLQREGGELSQYRLVIAGIRGWLSNEIFREIENSSFRESIQYIGCVEEIDKEYVYNLASLFVYPSFFEGFGFPPLEAMRCGIPVIVSNTSSLPEVIGSGGLMIDPDKPDELFRAMKEVLCDRGLKEKLISNGMLHAQKFNWANTARETKAVFDNS